MHTPYYSSYPESNPPESSAMREKWFFDGLKLIGEYFRTTFPGTITTIAVPDHIGCGLAAGN